LSALLLTAAAIWAAAGALGLGARRQLFVALSGYASAAAGALAVIAGVLLAVHGHASTILAPSRGAVVGALALRATPLAAPFAVLLGLTTLAIGVYVPRYQRAAGGTAVYLCAADLAAIASLGVLLAANVTTFLVAWESMTLTTGVLVLRHRRRPGVRQGAFLYLACGEAGFAMVVAAFAILAVQAHSMDLAIIAARAPSVSAGWRTAAFVLALAGFGFKAGLVPLHIWLPAAHPVAPADGSAFLSGMVVKLGVYGIALFAVVLLAHGPTWWGVLTMVVGAVSAVLGILYALMEKELKRFLAYSTVENVGIVVTALGAAMVFSSNGQRTLGAFLLIVALYHVVNHGCAKTLLFLEAGVVEHTTQTLDLDRLGGLVHRLRRSTVIVLVGTLAMAALPPLNGFVSEWLVFQGLFQGFRIPSHAIGVLVLLAAAALGLTAGLAVLAFVRAFGIGFLGIARSPEAARAVEDRQPILGPGLLAAACVALALGAPAVLVALARVAHAVTGVDLRPVLLLPNLTVIPAHTDFSAFSPTYLAVFLVAVSLVPVAIYLAGRPRGSDLRVPVWDGGMVQYRPRMQYSATAFANPVRVTFERLYRPDVHVDRASDDPAGRSGPVHYRISVTPIFERYLYRPVWRALQALSRWVEPLQSGDVNLYLFYILVVLVVALLVYRW
jgi:hydrogenase-4 component B